MTHLGKIALYLNFEMKWEIFDKSTIQFPGKNVTNITINFDSKVKQVRVTFLKSLGSSDIHEHWTRKSWLRSARIQNRDLSRETIPPRWAQNHMWTVTVNQNQEKALMEKSWNGNLTQAKAKAKTQWTKDKLKILLILFSPRAACERLRWSKPVGRSFC